MVFSLQLKSSLAVAENYYVAVCCVPYANIGCLSRIEVIDNDIDKV